MFLCLLLVSKCCKEGGILTGTVWGSGTFSGGVIDKWLRFFEPYCQQNAQNLLYENMVILNHKINVQQLAHYSVFGKWASIITMS